MALLEGMGVSLLLFACLLSRSDVEDRLGGWQRGARMLRMAASRCGRGCRTCLLCLLLFSWLSPLLLAWRRRLRCCFLWLLALCDPPLPSPPFFACVCVRVCVRDDGVGIAVFGDAALQHETSMAVARAIFLSGSLCCCCSPSPPPSSLPPLTSLQTHLSGATR